MHYPKGTMKLQLFFATVMAAAAQDVQNNQVKLPDGPGRDVTVKVCTTCHGLENVVRVRMTKQRWGTVVDDMVSRGATASDDEIEQIINYLAANFSKPKQEDPKP